MVFETVAELSEPEFTEIQVEGLFGIYERQSLLRVGLDRPPFGGCHRSSIPLTPPARCRGCIGTVPNSHHVLIMSSSLNFQEP